MKRTTDCTREEEIIIKETYKLFFFCFHQDAKTLSLANPLVDFVTRFISSLAFSCLANELALRARLVRIRSSLSEKRKGAQKRLGKPIRSLHEKWSLIERPLTCDNLRQFLGTLSLLSLLKIQRLGREYCR